MKLHKYTKVEYIDSIIEKGLFASKISKFNDPYESEGILYPDDYRICCVTSSIKKMLMWAHYGCHRGCAVSFEVTEDIEKVLKEVVYTKNLINHKEMNGEEVFSSLYLKGYEWEYEKEYRGIYKFGDDDKNNLWRVEKEDVYLNVPISEIRFGLWAEKDNHFINMLKYLKKYNEKVDNNKKIKISKCMLSLNKYEIVENKQWDYLKELDKLLNEK